MTIPAFVYEQVQHIKGRSGPSYYQTRNPVWQAIEQDLENDERRLFAKYQPMPGAVSSSLRSFWA